MHCLSFLHGGVLGGFSIAEQAHHLQVPMLRGHDEGCPGTLCSPIVGGAGIGHGEVVGLAARCNCKAKAKTVPAYGLEAWHATHTRHDAALLLQWRPWWQTGALKPGQPTHFEEVDLVAKENDNSQVPHKGVLP